MRAVPFSQHSLVGLLIEISFIAIFTRRFFAGTMLNQNKIPLASIIRVENLLIPSLTACNDIKREDQRQSKSRLGVF